MPCLEPFNFSPLLTATFLNRDSIGRCPIKLITVNDKNRFRIEHLPFLFFFFKTPKSPCSTDLLKKDKFFSLTSSALHEQPLLASSLCFSPAPTPSSAHWATRSAMELWSLASQSSSCLKCVPRTTVPLTPSKHRLTLRIQVKYPFHLVTHPNFFHSSYKTPKYSAPICMIHRAGIITSHFVSLAHVS